MTSQRVLFVGRATLDVVYALGDFPAQDTKTFARAMHVAPGGPATNAAITYALLGGRAMLMTAIGAGPWARPVCEELERLEIELIDPAACTAYEMPLATILVNEAASTRTIVNPPRSAIELNWPESWDAVWGEAPGLVLTDGFHLDETLPMLRSLHAHGAQIVLDGGSWKPGTDDLAPLLSVAICSERFAVPGRTADPEATIGWFGGQGVPNIAITRGAKPILGSDGGRRFDIQIEQIAAVDTAGAGDVLHGAFSYHFSRTGEFEPALRQAAHGASQSCRSLGIRGWI